MNPKNLLIYYKITIANPKPSQGEDRLRSAIEAEEIVGQVPLEMWKLSGLQTIPPPRCEVETGEKTGYSCIEAIFIRERENHTLVCISLEDDFHNDEKAMLKCGWKPWTPGDIEALAQSQT